MKISAVIITKNEEKNIVRCIKALSWTDEIIVADTDSSDNTLPIARKMGARVFSPEWRGYGITKQFAVDQAEGEWILSVDADEIIPADLAEEIMAVISSESPADGYYLPRLTNFIGKWIWHSQWYPDHVLRLFKKDKGHFTESMVHEKVIVNGETANLSHPMLHYSYPDLRSWFKKTKKYTNLGIEDSRRLGRKANIISLIVRPVATFYRHFIFHQGYIDGWSGFYIGILSSYRNFHKYLHIRRLVKSNK